MADLTPKPPEAAQQRPPQAWLDALADADQDEAEDRSSPFPEARARLLALIAELEASKATPRA